MDDWKQALNFEFSSLMKNPVVAFLYALVHSLELVILFFLKQLKQILTNSFLTVKEICHKFVTNRFRSTIIIRFSLTEVWY